MFAQFHFFLPRLHVACQVYTHIFRSPSSAQGDVVEAESLPPPSKKSKSRRRDVAATLSLTEVTPRTIAYASVQVFMPILPVFVRSARRQLLFALSDAVSWSLTHNGFDYKSFYNFIIDFFEAASGLAAKNRVRDLLKWWNQ